MCRCIGLFVVFIILGTSGCSINSASRQCKEMRRRGEVYSTEAACVQCVESMGTRSIEAVRGCAMGLDAAQLIVPAQTR